MSKRCGSPVDRPTKLNTMQDYADLVWSPEVPLFMPTQASRVVKMEPEAELATQMTPECVDLTVDSVEQPTHRTAERQLGDMMCVAKRSTFIQKVRVLQTYELSSEPRMLVTVSLHGVQPEVRFTSSDNAFVLTGDEFLRMADLHTEWLGGALTINNISLEPHQGGCRLTHLPQDSCAHHFDLPFGVVSKLRMKLNALTTHIRRLQVNKPNIMTMFECIVRVYRTEYLRMNVCRPIDMCFDDLRRVVDCHVPAYSIVRDFQYSTSGCHLNYYSLLSCALSQKAYICQLLQ